MKKILLSGGLILAAISLSACSLLPNAKSSQEAQKQQTSLKKEESLKGPSQSISQLPDYQTNPDLQNIQSFHIYNGLVSDDKEKTSYEQVVEVLGEPEEPSAEKRKQESWIDDWYTEHGSILVNFSNNYASTIIYNYKGDQTAKASHTSISKGMSAKQVFQKLGQPTGFIILPSDTSYFFDNDTGETFSVTIRGDKVISISEPEDLYKGGEDD